MRLATTLLVFVATCVIMASRDPNDLPSSLQDARMAAFMRRMKQKKGSLEGIKCQNPKGKNGDTYTEGCSKYTCKSGEWEEEDNCAATELSFGKTCRPHCPIQAPFCNGICLLNGLACVGKCYLFSADTRSCSVAAAQISSDECNTECSDATDTCQNCLLEKLPDNCEGITYAPCFLCTKSLLKAATYCKNNKTVACIKHHLSSSTCYPCICTILCSVAGKDHFLCKACHGNKDGPIDDDLWGPLPGADQRPKTCPSTWTQSFETTDSKCYKVAPDGAGTTAKVIWTQGQVTCKGIGGILAIPDNAARHAAVAAALSFVGSDTKDCWLSGNQQGTSETWYWVPPKAVGNPFDVKGSDFGVGPGCIDNGKAKPSCLYANVNGKACNDPCAEAKCVVCEMDPS